MMKINVEDFTCEKIKELKVGDNLLLSGKIYTARDAAHKRMTEDFEKGIDFPFDLNGAAVYYAGPCPAKPGEVIGSCGPTTAGRMDAYTPLLLQNGLKIMIGKGTRSDAVTEAIKQNGAIYLGAYGGAGALIAQCIKSSKVIAYEDLGTEAVRELYVEDFPCTVLTDTYGNDIYKIEPPKYRRD